MSSKYLSFFPQVANVTSGDDFSKRVFWEGDDIKLNERDPELCPEGKPKTVENCHSMEIWVPELQKGYKNLFIVRVKDNRLPVTAGTPKIKVGFTIRARSKPFAAMTQR